MKKEIKIFSLKYGLFLGFILLIVNTSFYLYNSKLLLPAINEYTITCILIVIMYSIYSLFNFKSIFRDLDFSFKTRFSICFLILCIATWIVKMCDFVLYNYINPELISEYAHYMYILQNSEEMGYDYDIWMGMMNNNFTLLNQIQAYVFGLIPCTLYSAIISLCVRNN